MAAKRELTAAYNGYAFGGESSTALPLGEARLTESYHRRGAEIDILIVGTTAALRSSETVTARAALAAKSKNLGITMGERITAADGVANGTTTFTSATGGFAAGDVGLPINIEGRGAYQIVAVGGSTSITLSGSPTTGTGLTWRVGYVVAQVTPSLLTNGGYVRCELAKSGAPRHDTPLSQRWTFRAGWEAVADNSGDAYRREAKVAIAYSGARQRTVTFSGQYTAGGGSNALANYLAGIAAWTATRLTEISASAAFEKVAEPALIYDDERQVLEFSVAYREVLYDQGLAGGDVSAIVRDSVGFRRSGVWTHGKAGQVAAVRATLTYDCEVNSTVTGATGLKALYTGTIKPFLLTRCASLLGGSVVVEGEDCRLSTATNEISCSLAVVLVGLGSNLVSYEETVVYALDEQWVFRKAWDGKPDTYHRFSPGHRITAVKTVTEESFEGGGGGSSGAAGGGFSFGGAAAGGFGLGFAGTFTPSNSGFSFGLAGPSAGSKGGGGGDLFGKPPARFGAAADGAWVAVSDQEALGPTRYIGQDVDYLGQTRSIKRTSVQQSFVWVSAASPGGSERIASTSSGSGTAPSSQTFSTSSGSGISPTSGANGK